MEKIKSKVLKELLINDAFVHYFLGPLIILSINQINDIRNYDDNLIFAVTGALKNYEEYKLLLDTACRFYDAVTNVVANYSKVLIDI
jgi:hypothetical protein